SAGPSPAKSGSDSRHRAWLRLLGALRANLLCLSRASLPGVGNWGFAAGAGEDLVEPLQHTRLELDLRSPQRLLQLSGGSRPNDGGGHHRIVQEPAERHVGRRFTNFFAEPFVRFELRSFVCHLLLEFLVTAAAFALLFQRTSEQPAPERAPGNQAEPVIATSRDHLELYLAIVQVIDALLTRQAHQATPLRLLTRSSEIPAGEIARAHVNDLALAYQRFHGLPDFVPGALPIDMVHLIDIDRLRLEAAQAIFAVAHDLQRRQ